MATPAAAAAAAVARILSARTHYDVLALAGAPVTTADVRRKYKELAVRVHPDKNRADGAADAFWRLSEAYECLADERLRRAYDASATQQQHKRKRKPPPPPGAPPAPPAAAPRFPRKQRWKKKPPPPPPPPPTSQPPLPRRWRTPEKVWAQFQREEEEQARREFLERGFERDFEPAGGNKKRRREDVGLSSSPPPRESRDVEADHTDDAIDSEAVQSRAQDWATWMKWPATQPQAKEPKSVDLESATPAACCLLCRRKFPTAEALARHEQLSALHKENLARQSSS